MAKPGLQNIITSQTFQAWLDRTNEIVDIFNDEVLTASASGDTTGSLGSPLTATLIGTFNANTISAADELITDQITPLIGSNIVTVNAQIFAESPLQTAAVFRASAGGRSSYSSASSTWEVGFENTTTNSFIINSGVGDTKFLLSTTGDLTLAGDLKGNANTASALETAVEINGVEFDGTDDITVTATTPFTLTRGTYLSGEDFDGSADTTWAVDADTDNTASKIVARDEDGNFSANIISAALDGNASSATVAATATTAGKLSASVNINNVPFDGSSDITVQISTSKRTTAESAYMLFTNAGDSGTGARNVYTNDSIRFNGSTGTLSATSIAATSDISLKENIYTISTALEKVRKLRGVEFTWKNSKLKAIGVIAQEIERVLPEVVEEVNDVKTVLYGNIVGLLIEAIKELEAKIEDR